MQPEITVVIFTVSTETITRNAILAVLQRYKR